MYRWFLFAPLIVVGCGRMPCSLVPLESNAELELDQRVDGSWELTSAKPNAERSSMISFGTFDDVFVTIVRQSKTQFSLALEHEEVTVPFEVTLCRIDEQLFWDLRRPQIEDPTIAGTTLRPHYFAKCTLKGDSMQLTGCDPGQYQELLESEGLPFKVVDSAVVFTGSGRQLQELIRRHTDKIFPVGKGDVILRGRSNDATH